MKQFKRTTNKQLGEILIERGVITRDQLNAAIKLQEDEGGLLGEVLVKLNFATEKDIVQTLTCQYGFPYLPLVNYEIDKEVVDSVPSELCRKYYLIPIDKIGKSLTLAMSNPLNIKAAEEIEAVTGCVVQIFVSTATDVKESIEKYYKDK